MVARTDLMQLGGMNHLVAGALARHVAVATAYGTSVASANKIAGTQYFTFCLTGTSSFALPQVTANGGAYLGDEFFIANMSSAAVAVYIANTAAGSVVTIYGSAASTAGTTGVAVPAGTVGRFVVVSNSTWAMDTLVDPALLPTDPRQLEIVTPVTATAYGTSAGSANPIGSTQYFTLCLTGTSSFLLPAVSAAPTVAPYLGDVFKVANMSTASIKVYAANNAAGSVVTMYGGAASTAGTTGVTVPAGLLGTFQVYNGSTWVCNCTSV